MTGNKNKFNLIGFNFPTGENKEYKHCIFCKGRRLQPDPHDDSKLMCFSCGYSVLAKEAPNEEGIALKHNKHQTAIISAKNKNKKYYDKQGNEINDPDLIADIGRGANVISYHEEKSGKDTTIDTRNKRVIRNVKK